MGSVFGLSFREGCERSEEHTSELQSQSNLVCRLLLEIKTADHGGAPILDYCSGANSLPCSSGPASISATTPLWPPPAALVLERGDHIACGPEAAPSAR